ncbi:MAG: hypothetical protein K8R56_09500 [Candidatus Eisenbacteria bacterium]|nr:hypothetical protein [Candidatus Eisenbacteria bacterium]
MHTDLNEMISRRWCRTLACLGMILLACAPIPANAQVPFLGWAPQGVQLTVGTANRFEVKSVDDGAGGLYVGWTDASGIYVQHVFASGLLDPTWTPTGVLVGAPNSSDLNLIRDGAGGCYVTWFDFSTRGHNVRRLAANGLPPTDWQPGTSPIRAAGVWTYSACEDGQGGIWLVLFDRRASCQFGHPCVIWFTTRVLRIRPDGTSSAGWASPGKVFEFPTISSTEFLYDNPTAIPRPGGVDLLQSGQKFGESSTFVSTNRITIREDGSQSVERMLGESAINSSAVNVGLVADASGRSFLALSMEGYPLRLSAYDASVAWTYSQPEPGALLDLAADGVGGVYMGSIESASGQVRLQHHLNTGVRDTNWPQAGVGLPASSVRLQPRALEPFRDASVLHGWVAATTTGSELRLQRIGVTGAVDPTWPVAGFPVRQGAQGLASVVWCHPGGRALSFFVWSETRDGQTQLYAQRVDFDRPVATEIQRATYDRRTEGLALNWEFASSQLGRSWNVERSGTEGGPVILGRAGTGATERELVFLDGAPSDGDAVYELVDPETRRRVGGINVPAAAVSFGLRATGMIENGLLKVKVSGGTATELTVELFDLGGRVVAGGRVRALAGDASTHWFEPRTELSNGLYWLRVQAGQQRALSRVVRVR